MRLLGSRACSSRQARSRQALWRWRLTRPGRVCERHPVPDDEATPKTGLVESVPRDIHRRTSKKRQFPKSQVHALRWMATRGPCVCFTSRTYPPPSDSPGAGCLYPILSCAWFLLPRIPFSPSLPCSHVLVLPLFSFFFLLILFSPFLFLLPPSYSIFPFFPPIFSPFSPIFPFLAPFVLSFSLSALPVPLRPSFPYSILFLLLSRLVSFFSAPDRSRRWAVSCMSVLLAPLPGSSVQPWPGGALVSPPGPWRDLE